MYHQDFFKENAPDIKVIEFHTPQTSIDDYDLEAFGQEHKIPTQEMVKIVLTWLSAPLIQDEAENDSVRIAREENFPEEVSGILLNHRAHPSRITNVLYALEVILYHDQESETNLLDQSKFLRIPEIIEEYDIFTTLRNHLDDTNAQVWERVLSHMHGEDLTELSTYPYYFINKKIADLVEEIEHIAFEVLQKLEKKR